MLPIVTLLGIAAPAAVLIFVLRRYDELPWRIAALLLAIVLGVFAPVVFTSRMPVPLDEVVRGDPYKAVVGPVRVGNPLSNDTVKQMLPWMHVAREELFAGRWPLWNRHQFSGYPLLANAQSAPFSPFFLATLFVPLPKQLVAMAALKTFCALVFLVLLCRRERVSWTAAIGGAGVFAFSIFQTVYLYYPMTAVTALLPAVLYGIAHALDRGQIRSYALLAAASCAVFLGGHPESAFHVAIAAGAFLLLERPPWRRIAPLLLAAFAGVLVAAPAWLPALEQVRISARFAQIAAATHRMTEPMPPIAAWVLLHPDSFGNPARGTWAWIHNYAVVAPTYVGLATLVLCVAQTILSVLVHPSRWRTAQTGLSVPHRQASAPHQQTSGVRAPTGLSVPHRQGSAPHTASRDLWLFAFALLFFLIAMNWTFVAHPINAVPPFSLVANDRFRFASACLLALLVARGIEHARRTRWIALALLAPAAWLVWRLWGTRIVGWESLAGLVALALLVITTRKKVLAAVAILELVVLGFAYNALTPGEYYVPRLPIVDALHSFAGNEPERIVGTDWMLLPNAAAQYGLEDIRGSDPMAWAPYVAFLRTLETKPNVDVQLIENVQQPGIDFLNVRWILTDKTLPPPYVARYDSFDGRLYENPRARRRFFAPRNDAQIGPIGQHTPTRITFDVLAPAPAFIASSQPAMPGWRVRVNGNDTRILPIHAAFLGFHVPAGRTRVQVTYRPRSFTIGLAIAALTLLAAVPAGRVLRRRARRRG